ncbi:MAG: AAA family ATPase [Cyanobacteria bacterium CRU_2_1]|nr:AAA family ATPase [Cyanobacteria bacterium CRU_2_1]
MEALSHIWQMLHSYQTIDSYQTGLTSAFNKISTPPTPPTPTVSVTPSSAEPPKPSSAQPQASESPASEPPKSEAELSHILDQALAELNDLVGMENIKEEVKTLANFLKVQKIRQERGLAKTPVSLHAVFCGPPGTGKTTIARLMSRIYQGLGFLKKGHLVETDRSGMVAGYIGQTAKNVDELVKSALDGVLFIDEAYALVPKDANRDFGQEAIDVLLKRMEDHRDRFVVIVAGYTDEMTTFIESNPGLKSRFNRYFYFNDYTPNELLAIFEKMAAKSHFKLTSEARTKLRGLFEQLYVKRDRSFGNARVARNLFEKSIEQQANRLAVLSSLTDDVLTTLLPEDIPTRAASTLSGTVNWQDLASPSKSQSVSAPDPFQSSQAPDLEAIASRLNQVLQSENITAKATLRDHALRIMLESPQLPDEQAMTALVKQEIAQLELGTVTQISVYGRQPGEDIPAWSEDFELEKE